MGAGSHPLPEVEGEGERLWGAAPQPARPILEIGSLPLSAVPMSWGGGVTLLFVLWAEGMS